MWRSHEAVREAGLVLMLRHHRAAVRLRAPLPRRACCNAGMVIDDACHPALRRAAPAARFRAAARVGRLGAWGQPRHAEPADRPGGRGGSGGVRTGERIGVSLPLGLPDPPFFGRKGFRHHFEPMGPPPGTTGWTASTCSARRSGTGCGTSGRARRLVRRVARASPPTTSSRSASTTGRSAASSGGACLSTSRARAAHIASGGYDPFTRVAFRPGDLSAALTGAGRRAAAGTSCACGPAGRTST